MCLPSHLACAAVLHVLARTLVGLVHHVASAERIPQISPGSCLSREAARVGAAQASLIVEAVEVVICARIISVPAKRLVRVAHVLVLSARHTQ